VKAAGTWAEIAASKALINWAKVTGGTVTTYTAGDGSTMEVHTFTANGTLMVDTAGYAEVLVIGGGARGQDGYNGGSGYPVRGLHSLAAGSHAVSVGATGGASSLGDLAGQGAFVYGHVTNEFTDDITGTALTYGGPINSARPGSPTSNGGATAQAGIVIVRVQTSPPTISGVVATGGTESTYIGNGSNGVLNQSYKVHKFTTSGSLVVTQGGAIDVLCVGGGGGSGNSGPVGGGGGGGFISTSISVPSGTLPIVVGAGGNPGANGGVSSLNPVYAYGGGAGNGGAGASGGGGEGNGGGAGAAIAGQGNVGYLGSGGAGGGGGGAGAAATSPTGGAGKASSISGTATTYGKGGDWGGGAGSANTGDGGAGNTIARNPGGSGVVIVRVAV